MAIGFKFKNNKYLDSTGIVHNKKVLSGLLDTIIGNRTVNQEFPTSEYVDGKQVYVKRINLGNLPAAGNRNFYAMGMAGSTIKMIRMIGCASNGDMHITIPYTYLNELIGICTWGSTLELYSQKDMSQFLGYLDLYYTKN